MRVFFTSGTTGVPKNIEYSAQKIAGLKDQLRMICEIGGLDLSGEEIKNTYNLFPVKNPSLGWWQTTMFGEFDNVRHFDAGDANFDDLAGFWNCYKPWVLVGDPITIESVLRRISDPNALSELRHVVIGGTAVTQTLIEFVKAKTKAQINAVYAQTELGICFITEDNKFEEGYVIDKYEGVSVEISKINSQIIINGFATGDIGTINDLGKLDLNITRMAGDGLPKFCPK